MIECVRLARLNAWKPKVSFEAAQAESDFSTQAAQIDFELKALKRLRRLGFIRGIRSRSSIDVNILWGGLLSKEGAREENAGQDAEPECCGEFKGEILIHILLIPHIVVGCSCLFCIDWIFWKMIKCHQPTTKSVICLWKKHPTTWLDHAVHMGALSASFFVWLPLNRNKKTRFMRKHVNEHNPIC